MLIGMKLHGILFIGVVLAVLHATHSISCAYHGGKDHMFNDMVRNINDFSVNLYKAVLNNPSVEENFISSPLSAAMVLLMAGFGARGSTAAELNQFLHPESLTECTVRLLTSNLSSYRNVELSLAYNIFADTSLYISSEFQASIELISISDIERVDFKNSDVAARTINEWCEQKTHSRIRELVTPDDVNVDTALVLVNAIYFKGIWSKQFHKLLGLPGSFVRADGHVIDVPMMFTEDKFFYGRLAEISATFIELPYESRSPHDRVSMFIILPDEHDGLGKVENGIRGVNLERFRFGQMQKMRLMMPLFKIESKIELTDILQAMGMREIFSDRADFSGISKNSTLKISKIVQKVFIEVSERGSEVSAASGALIRNKSGFGSFIFNVDHPFLVLIATENVILFSGRVTDPRQ